MEPREDATSLVKRLSYDPKTGQFHWLGPQNAGQRAGGLNGSRGYRYICRHGEQRLAWLMFYGAEPRGWIDHINGVRDDNRIGNLRIATRAQNAINGVLRADNASGYRGVSWFKQIRKWRADIALEGGRRKYLGSFATPEAAGAAYRTAAQLYHGDFFRST